MKPATVPARRGTLLRGLVARVLAGCATIRPGTLGDERDLALGVDLGQPRQLAGLDAAPAVEHAHADVRGVDLAQ